MKIAIPFLLACVLAPAPAAAQTLREARELYFQGEINESLAMFEQLHAANPGDREVQVWLAVNHREFAHNERARELVDAVLRDEPCHAQAVALLAQLVESEAFIDLTMRDSAWAHQERAVRCAPDDGNAWLEYWRAATLRRDQAAEQRAQRRLAELRFITEPAMEFGRWTLRSAPPNAVLFTSNDRDWVPVSIAQTVEGLRPDVTVVFNHMLHRPWYVRRVAQATGYPVPPAAEGREDEEIMPDDGDGSLMEKTAVLWAREWTEGRNPRPLVVAFGTSTLFLRDAVWARLDGPLYTLHPAPDARPDAPRIDPDAFAALLPHLEIARLNGPRVHPSDRVPAHYAAGHRAETFMVMLREYGSTLVERGRMDQARQALARMEELRATGVLRPGYAAEADRLREMIEGRQ
jgi:hypothetical protein